MLSKPELERFTVSVFLEKTGRAGSPVPQPPGKGPDFVLFGGTTEVGIEVTAIYHEPEAGRPARRLLEGIQDQILVGAKLLWDSEIGIPVEVHPHFNLRRLPTKSALASTVAQLVAAVAESLPEVGQATTVRRIGASTVPMPPSVHAVTIARLAAHTESHWMGGGAVRVPDLTVGQVQSAITAKNRKAGQYMSGVRPTWLVIALNGHQSSGTFELPEETLTHGYVSAFQETHLIDLFRGSVVTLNTNPPDPGSAA